MSNKQYSRRQILQYMTTMGILSALPMSVLAQVTTKQLVTPQRAYEPLSLCFVVLPTKDHIASAGLTNFQVWYRAQ
jgi:hypothetical protein